MKRVLFVDDEPAILDGLRARLHAQRKYWHMEFVESGACAIAQMQQQAFDVVVTDMHMPHMDGAQLLDNIHARWPATIRIVLSGYAQDEQTTRLLPVAHQYLSKPCDPQQLEGVIDRCVHLHDVLTSPRLRTLVGRIRQLPARPEIYSRLCTVMARGDATGAHVAQVISADMAIAAKVLQIVNSAFFRRARAITKLENAVTHLGFEGIRNIVMSVEVFSQWGKQTTPMKFDYDHLQLHAQKVAAIAHALTRNLPIADDSLMAGLLHSIGYWLLVQECPQEIQAAQELAVERGIVMHAAELEVLGASNAEVGAYLLGIWGLPQSVVEAVAFQYSAEQTGRFGFGVLEALVTAVCLEESGATDAFGLPRASINVEHEFQGRFHAPFDWQEARRRAAAATGSATE